MSSANYPRYTRQPFEGDLISMFQAGPMDLLYSSGTAPYYQRKIDRAHGRMLAGLGDTTMEENYYPNELRVMAELDDVLGDGIFDPEGTHGQVHPNAGIFAAHYSMQGYLAREKMFSPSEVVDATTGRPILPVPGGAVAHDDVAKIAYLESQALNQYRPNTLPYSHRVPDQAIDQVMMWKFPVSGLGDEAKTPAPSGTSSSGLTTWVAVAAGALAAGALVGMMLPKKRGRR